jgi:hypothetical protein
MPGHNLHRLTWIAAALACAALWPAAAAAEIVWPDLYATLGTERGFILRGRLVSERARPDLRAATPLSQMSQDEVASAAVTLRLLTPRQTPVLALGEHRADAEGRLRVAVEAPPGALRPGRYLIEVRHEGRVIGFSRLRLLAWSDEGVVVRSDIDQTWLATEFVNKLDKARLLSMSAPEREALPGMSALYPALRVGDGAQDRPLIFLSGSPDFFKRTLEARMELEQIDHEGLLLKPFGGIARRKIAQRRPGEIPAELKAQVGYKLAALLEQRLELPPRSRELLLGDDSEADFLVYALYHRLTAGELSVEGLIEALRGLEIDLYWRVQVRRLAPLVVAHLEVKGPVQGIYINRTGKKASTYNIDDWRVEGLTRHHRGAWPLALDLYEEGWLSCEGLRSVRVALEGRAEVPERSEGVEEAVAAGWLRAEVVGACR